MAAGSEVFADGLGLSAVVAVTTLPENENGLVPMSWSGLGWADDKYSELSTDGVASGIVGAGAAGIVLVVGGGAPASTAAFDGFCVVGGGIGVAGGAITPFVPAGPPRGLCPAGVFITRS